LRCATARLRAGCTQKRESISALKSVLGRFGRKFCVALSACDLCFRLNLALEVSAQWTSPFIPRRDQLHGFLGFSCFAHLICSRDDFVVIRVRGRERRPIGDFEEDSAPNSPTHFDQYAAGSEGKLRLAVRNEAPTFGQTAIQRLLKEDSDSGGGHHPLSNI
jgi:hypothetical protein